MVGSVDQEACAVGSLQHTNFLPRPHYSKLGHDHDRPLFEKFQGHDHDRPLFEKFQ